jgi:hypothetical protein
VPTGESIGDVRAHHDLTKLDLAAVGSNLTMPHAARMVAFVCWIASRMVASEYQITACDASPHTAVGQQRAALQNFSPVYGRSPGSC